MSTRSWRRCTKCGRGHTHPSRLQCYRCRKAAREYMHRAAAQIAANAKAARELLLANGICTSCKAADAAPDRGQCEPCASELVRRRKAKAEAMAANGRCTKCGVRKHTEHRLCAPCRRKIVHWRKARTTVECRCGVEHPATELACPLCRSISTRSTCSLSEVVGVVRRSPRLSVYEIAEECGRSVRTCLRILKRLQAARAVERLVDEERKARYLLVSP